MHLLSYTEGLERLRPISDKQLHLFQHISSASTFQNPLPLTLRYNLADFSIWIYSGCSKKDQWQPQLEFSRIWIQRTRLDRQSLVFRVM